MRNLRCRFAIVSLARRLPGRHVDRERGAIGVLVAVFLAGGVLFGMGAMVIDVGRLYQNRAELQNGADAAALAVAKSCSIGTCPATEGAADLIASPYAKANASALTGGSAGIFSVCGTYGNGTVGGGACPATPDPGCPANPGSGSFVDVRTNTLLPNNTTILPPVFAETVVSGYNGAEVTACAQAKWGVTDTLGVTICSAWEASASSKLVPYPITGVPPISDEVTFSLDNATCNGAPGNVGWTNPNSSTDCSTVINGTQYGGNTGASNNNTACAKAFSDAWNAGSTAGANPTAGNWQDAVYFLPMFSNVQNPGSSATYTLAGYVGFVVTSYNVPSMGMSGSGKGNSAQDWFNTSGGCQKTNKCITGFFVNETLPPQQEGGISLSG